MKGILFLVANILGIMNLIAFIVTKDLSFGIWTVIMLLLVQDYK